MVLRDLLGVRVGEFVDSRPLGDVEFGERPLLSAANAAHDPDCDSTTRAQ